MKKPERGDVLRGGTQAFNSCRSLDYARGKGPIEYFNDLCKPIET